MSRFLPSNPEKRPRGKPRILPWAILMPLVLTLGWSPPISPFSLSPSPAVAQTPESREAEADRLIEQGNQELNRGEFPAAIQSYQQALSIYQEIENFLGIARSQANLGSVYNFQEQYQEAINYYLQALANFRYVEDPPRLAKLLNNLGIAYRYKGEYLEAINCYQQSLEIAQQIDDRSGIANSLNNLAFAYISLEQYQKAINYHRQSVQIKLQIEDDHKVASFMNDLGNTYLFVGQYREGINYHQRSLDIKRKLEDSQGIAYSLGNLGSGYFYIGQYWEAINYHRQSLEIKLQLEDSQGIADSLNALGIAYNSLEQYREAINYYQQSLEIVRDLKDAQGIAYALGNMGSGYLSLGLYREAINYYQQSLEISRQIEDTQGIAASLNNLGIAYRSLGQYRAAINYSQESLEITRQIGARAGEGLSLNNLGYTLFKLNQLEPAEKLLREAIEIYESLREGLEEAQKISLADTQSNPYRILQQVLIAQNKPEDALEISERGRARTFVELLAARGTVRDESNLASIPAVEPPTIADIQRIAATQNATLVEYSLVGDNQLYIWVIQPRGELHFIPVDLTSLQDQNTSLAQLVNHTREKISNKESEIPELRQLHQLLIEPIAQFLPDDPQARVILIPQSELFLLPFPALQDAQGNYLIQHHTLLTAPAIQALDFSNNPRQTGAPQTTQPGALVVGNPTMPKHDPPLDPLPGAEKEANQIAQVLNTQALTGDAATKSAVLSQLSQSSVIHLATHGTFDERRGMDSAVALAPSPRNPGDGEAEAWEREDGFLTAGEIVDLKIPAELVVLSACDTGRGAITGDGVIGLSRAWLMAGTSTVFVSLWRIDDNEPLTVISEFYQQLQTHPDAAAALRQGMLKGIDSKVALKNWAAFTVIGEAQVPFVSEQSRGIFALSWIEIGILSVAGVGVMLILQRQLLPRVTPAWSLVSKQRHLLIPAVGVVAAVFVVNGSIRGVQWWLKQPIEYHNPTYGLKLQVPRQWTIQEPQDPIRGTIAMFVAPPESGKAQFYSNVSIAVQDLSSDPKTLEQYTDKAVQEIQEYLTEAQFLQPPTPINLGNQSGYEVMYIGKVGEQEVQRLQVWMMKEDQVYVITYESEKEQFNRVFIPVKEMIKSLEIEAVSP